MNSHSFRSAIKSQLSLSVSHIEGIADHLHEGTDRENLECRDFAVEYVNLLREDQGEGKKTDVQEHTCEAH